MLPELWRNVRRLLVLLPGNAGDVVLTAPALKALRRALPKVHLTLMTSPWGCQAAPLLPWIDDVLAYHALWQDTRQETGCHPRRELALVATLRRGAFDAAVILTAFHQSPYPAAYLCYLAGIPVRIGQSRDFGGSVLSHWVKPLQDHAHVIDRHLFLLEATGIPVAERHLELAIPREAAEQAQLQLEAAGLGQGKEFFVLAPGDRCASRRYDPHRFAAAVKLFRARTDTPIVLTASPEEERLAAQVTAGCGGAVISLAGMTSIPGLAHIIRRSSLVIANNALSMHLADAFRKPLVVLFSGADRAEQWQPRSAPARLLTRRTDCSPCYAAECPRNRECLDLLPHEIVYEAAKLLQLQPAPAVKPLYSKETSNAASTHTHVACPR